MEYDCLKTGTNYFGLFRASVEQIMHSMQSLEKKITGFVKQPDDLINDVAFGPEEVANNMAKIASSLEHVDFYFESKKQMELENKLKEQEDEIIRLRAELINLQKALVYGRGGN